MTDVSHNSGDAEWFDADVEASDGEPQAVAALLRSFAGTIEQAPDGYRYDVEMTVTERTSDGGSDP